MKKNHFLIKLLAIAVMLSCSDNDGGNESFVNLSSELNIESNTASAVEGNYLYLNLFLTKALSKDVLLQGNFSTEGIGSYINEDDYKKDRIQLGQWEELAVRKQQKYAAPKGWK